MFRINNLKYIYSSYTMLNFPLKENVDKKRPKN